MTLFHPGTYSFAVFTLAWTEARNLRPGYFSTAQCGRQGGGMGKGLQSILERRETFQARANRSCAGHR